jgi:hypothetical protein
MAQMAQFAATAIDTLNSMLQGGYLRNTRAEEADLGSAEFRFGCNTKRQDQACEAR